MIAANELIKETKDQMPEPVHLFTNYDVKTHGLDMQDM